MTVRRRLSLPAHAAAALLLDARVTSTVGGTPVTVRLSEVEAYGGEGEDPGSHAFRGPTARTRSMFGPAGHAYVYFTYGMHWCVNIVTGVPGEASAVLLRAGEIVEGHEVARARRPAARSDRDLARGPARLAAALGITGELDGIDVLAPGSPIRLRMASRAHSAVAVTPRTGVAGPGAGTPWRFHCEGDPTVSPYRPAARRVGRAQHRAGGAGG